ncbi:MAG TPA: hypothetical protein VM598_11250 [Bdellovibrionota bacterium]|nr:hypothetical protein [Bdellovibrionota bacterium]
MSGIGLSFHLLALAVLIQTAELLAIRRSWSDEGIWRWPVLRREFANFPSWFLFPLDALLSERGFHGLLWIRLLGSVIALFSPPNAALLAMFFITTLLIALRWRGTFNGGSDTMTALVSFGLWEAVYFGDTPWLARGGLALIAVALTLSYVVAGAAKLTHSAWREGKALGAFLRIPGYDHPPAWAKRVLEDPVRARRASHAILAFECAFPLAWLHPAICAAFLSVGVIFHLANFAVFGLNRFFFAWLAAYPILLAWTRGSV